MLLYPTVLTENRPPRVLLPAEAAGKTVILQDLLAPEGSLTIAPVSAPEALTAEQVVKQVLEAGALLPAVVNALKFHTPISVCASALRQAKKIKKDRSRTKTAAECKFCFIVEKTLSLQKRKLSSNVLTIVRKKMRKVV
jgi:hypothetical protein